MLKVIKNDNIYCIPGPLRLPFIGTKWQQMKMNKLHEYYAGKDLSDQKQDRFH